MKQASETEQASEKCYSKAFDGSSHKIVQWHNVLANVGFGPK